MNSSVTIRLPGLAIPPDETETSLKPAAALVAGSAISDEVLMAQICAGSREALAVLFHRYSRIVRAVAYRVLRDTSEADDLLQDVFLLVHRDCKWFDSSKASARFWILQMAYRRAISRRRYLTTRHFYQRLDVDEVADYLPDLQNKVGRLDNSLDGVFGTGKGAQAAAALSENQRQTLRLHFVEGYTFDEIARKLGQSRGNVKHNYFRGLEKLRKELLGGKLERERAV
jgi:RNA polymerase sigma-70 factor (ECF subfamily)